MTESNAERRPPGAIRRTPHAWGTMKRIPWPVCRGCGLVWLKNETTLRAVKRGHWLFAGER
jgi:hypothetical protein